MALTMPLGDGGALLDSGVNSLEDAGRKQGSPYEMLKAYAADLCDLVIILRDIEHLFSRTLGDNLHLRVEPELVTAFEGHLEFTEKCCNALGLNLALEKLPQIRKAFLDRECAEAVHVMFYELRGRIKDELKSRYFLYIPQSEVAHYQDPCLFGEKVHRRFMTANADTEEAGKCLALGRHTACVFHLMRVMELGVKALGKKLKLSNLKVDKPWGEITIALDVAIKSLPQKTPGQKKKKEQYSTVLAHLNAVRIAWRNTTMHPKLSYSSEEAHQIFAHAKAFMCDLAEII
jgi:hypothetical protein